MLRKCLALIAFVGLITIGSAQTYYTLTTEANPNVLMAPSGAGSYEEGTEATVSAYSPQTYDMYVYVFTDWDGDVADEYSLTTTVYMDADKTVVANYQQMEEVTTAKSQGYWKNRPGQMELTLDDAIALNDIAPWLDYFNETDLTAFKNQVKTYLTPKAKDSMQKKLGMQLLTAALNVLHGYLDPTRDVWYDVDMDGVYDPADETFNIGTVILNGIAAWSSGVDQAYYKNLLDWINSNELLYIVY